MPQVLYLNPQEAAEEAIKNNLQLPEGIFNGRIKTMNDFGVMRRGRGVYEISTKQFLEIASKPGSKVLEIGAAYGEVCLEALKNGSTDYTAVDLEDAHLKILARRVKEELPDKLSCIKLIAGGVPNSDFDKYVEKGAYDAILIENVLHFLSGEQIIEGWIKPEIRNSLEKQVNEFETFLRDSSSTNIQALGFFKSRSEIMDFDKYPQSQEYVKSKPPIFIFHPEVLRYFFEQAGFIVEECCFRPINVEPYKLDGKERVMIIARS